MQVAKVRAWWVLLKHGRRCRCKPADLDACTLAMPPLPGFGFPCLLWLRLWSLASIVIAAARAHCRRPTEA